MEIQKNKLTEDLIPNDILLTEKNIIVLIKFLQILIPNCSHKDIFSSFDHLGLIFKETMDLKIKTKIIEIIMLFNGIKKNSLDNNLDFVDYFNFGIYLRPIIIEHILEKNRKLNIENKKKNNFSSKMNDVFSESKK